MSAKKGNPAKCIFCGAHPTFVGFWIMNKTVSEAYGTFGRPKVITYTLCDQCQATPDVFEARRRQNLRADHSIEGELK